MNDSKQYYSNSFMKPENRFFFWMYLIGHLPYMVFIPVIVSDLFHPPWITLLSVITLTFGGCVIKSMNTVKLEEMHDILKN